MKLIVAGSRDYNNKDYVYLMISKIILYNNIKISEIISGGAKGVDEIGEMFAKEHNIKLKIFKANWNKHGKAAGPIRNKEMAEYSDILIAFYNGSKGTSNMINQMQYLNKPIFIVNI